MCNLVWSEMIWNGWKKNAHINNLGGLGRCEHMEPLRHPQSFCCLSDCFNGYIYNLSKGELHPCCFWKIWLKSLMLFFTLRFHWAFFLFTHLLSRLVRNNLDSWWVLMQMDKYHLRIENSDFHKHFPRSFSWRPAHVPHGTLISLSLNFTFTGGIATCFISLSKQAGSSSSSSSFLNGETRGRWKLLSKNRYRFGRT